MPPPEDTPRTLGRGKDPESSLTDWSQVRCASDPQARDYRSSRESIAARYWPIIHAFVRQSGRSEEQARDLTQGFVTDVLFGRRLLELAAPERGRFRTLLLDAVTNYLRDDHRRQTALRRAPEEGITVSGGQSLSLCNEHQTPETAFNRAWVAMLMREAAKHCLAECEAEGRQAQWLCLEHRVLRPALDGSPPATTYDLLAITGLGSVARVAHAIAAGKRRFARHLLNALGVSDDDNRLAREEISQLLGLLDPPR